MKVKLSGRTWCAVAVELWALSQDTKVLREIVYAAKRATHDRRGRGTTHTLELSPLAAGELYEILRDLPCMFDGADPELVRTERVAVQRDLHRLGEALRAS